jgi:hypothetical protein
MLWWKSGLFKAAWRTNKISALAAEGRARAKAQSFYGTIDAALEGPFIHRAPGQ